MRIRTLAAAVALVASSAAAVSAEPPTRPAARSVSIAGHRPAALGFRPDDFRSVAALRAARLRIFAERAKAARRVGATGSDQQLVWGWGNSDSALPDVDGDGVGDVLSSQLFTRTPAMKVLSGRTGRVLWSTPTPYGLTAVYVPAPGGKSVLLLLSESGNGEGSLAGGGGVDTFTVRAVNPRTGASLWSTSITGAFTYGVTGFTDVGLGNFDGVLARKNATPCLLLERFSSSFVGVTFTTSTVPEVIDAGTGNIVSSGAPAGGTWFSYVTPVGDLDADGVDDYVLSTDGKVPTLSARSGATGEALWTDNSTDEAYLTGLLATSPDLSGDHKPDLLIGWYRSTGAAVDAVDGATGTTVWSAPGDWAEPIGDLDHDRRSDTRVETEGSRLTTLSAISAAGKRLWSHAVVIPTGTRGVEWDGGDLDGDGFGEVYVEFVPAKSPGPAKSAEIVSGRTGTSRAVPDLGWPLGVSLRGGAPSFVRGIADRKGFALTAYDGRSRRAFWRIVVKSSDLNQMTMLDEVGLGHGRVGLLALLSGRAADTVVLLDGRRGTTLWKMTYQTLNNDAGLVI